MPTDDGLAILIVDDRADKLLALSAVLEDICPNIITADSGRKALLRLLEREFAVILLDVNMPVMDGFETAALIRQRKYSEHTPIIFVTAFSDDMLVARGYSLGAVDYIMAPIVPEVLRTKVSVFLELHRKTREVRLQAERLRRRAEQLNRLTQASLSIHASPTAEAMLRLVSDAARDVLGARAATTIGAWDQGEPLRWCTSAAETAMGADADWERAWHELARASGAGALKPSELPAWRSLGAALAGDGPLRWLAAPLTDREGRTMGLVHVCDKLESEFNEDDEAVLAQLARMSSIAVENAINAEAREANRLKDEFLATLSHELRTPLSALLGWTQLLRTGALDEAETSHGLEVIERNVLAQARLIDDLLDVSRIVAGKLRLKARRVALVSVVEAALDVVRRSAESKRLVLDLQVDAGPCEVMGDPDRLQQAVWNLLVNAVKFSQAGGRVRVRLGRLGDEAQIEVSDAGEGISPDFLPRIFDRFRQAERGTKRSHGGLGLGLAIVRHVVELHGGGVHAASPGPGQGATFWVNLPLAPAPLAGELPIDREPPGAESAMNEPINLSGLRLLVVDDDADSRQTIARLLAHYGADVETAAGAREALRMLTAKPPDVLISDIGMPGEDGYDLIRQVRALSSDDGGAVPALALTAFARDEDLQRALVAGYQRHAAKPVEPAELAALVAELGQRPEENDGGWVTRLGRRHRTGIAGDLTMDNPGETPHGLSAQSAQGKKALMAVANPCNPPRQPELDRT
jgi:signal transduction histidine kinase